MRAGSISSKAPAAKQLAALRATRAQKSKEAAFDAKSKDEGELRQPNGALKTDKQLGDPKMNKKDRISKGGRAGPEDQPIYREHIDGEAKAPAFKGSPNMKGSAEKMGAPSGVKASVPKQGGQYGGGGRDTQ